MMDIECSYCNKKCEKTTGHYNRAIKLGAPLFCSKECVWNNRKLNKTSEQKKEQTRLYDIKYRELNIEKRKKWSKDWFQRTYDPVKAAEYRKSRMHLHIEYCKQPWYREWKKKYDRVYRAKKFYGQFWEHYLLILDIEKEALSKQSWQEMNYERGNTNKQQTRRREYEKLISNQLETIPLGNLNGNQSGYKTT